MRVGNEGSCSRCDFCRPRLSTGRGQSLVVAIHLHPRARLAAPQLFDLAPLLRTLGLRLGFARSLIAKRGTGGSDAAEEHSDGDISNLTLRRGRRRDGQRRRAAGFNLGS